ncbi:MAG: dipeptidyl peptidase 3 [Prevotellaceae bacterium]|jgi:dipeptidyl-peptidase-3|nr:dipeptidyl peptidase 3 [Prevotellaceae bacterium]
MKKISILIMTAAVMLVACGGDKKQTTATPEISDFNFRVDTFADIEILRYRVPDFDSLTLEQKTLVYYLSQAALAGRDIIYDQNCRYNIAVRRTLEAVYENYRGDRRSDDFAQMTTYLKQVWMGNGIHHHYSSDKFTPHFSQTFFNEAVKSIDSSKLPLAEGQAVDSLLALLGKVIFDPDFMPKRVNQADGVDLLLTSAENYYENVAQQEAEDFYAQMKQPDINQPLSYGLNSKLVKENGQLVEKTWKVGGMYDKAISQIIFWLNKAAEIAENPQQKKVIETLVDYYQTGDLQTFDHYCIDWVADVNSLVDFINGFTEVYGDPLGIKASWEAVTNFKNIAATKRTEQLSSNAQWFEDNAPIDPRFRKETVKGITAKVITVAMLGGDCYPSTPIGINLPNANWIRSQHGSKSVTMENITEAYDQASLNSGFAQEFYWSDTERARAKEYGPLTGNLHTDLHECLGHASGKLEAGVSKDNLKAYGSTIEEARADLFALYYIADPKMVELGLLPNDSAYMTEFYTYIMNGLMTQLTRIKPGKDIEEAHMRNRALIAHWCYEQGKAENIIEFKEKDGKTYVVVNDYDKLRTLFGHLLKEVQTITSTGNFAAARSLVETYGVKVNQTLLNQVIERYATLKIKPYKGFVNPVYTAKTDKNGKIIDIEVAYTENYTEQQLRYSKEYGFLPVNN